MQTQIEEYVHTCYKCQTTKKKHKRYRFLPAKKAETEPWLWINMDLVGPYTVKTYTKMYTLKAITIIDLATGWPKIAYMNEPNLETTQKIFDSYWLAHHP